MKNKPQKKICEKLTEKLEFKQAHLPEFFLLIFIFSLPIEILAVLTAHLIPEGLPIKHIGFLMIMAPITVAFILTYKEKGLKAAKNLVKRSVDYKRIKEKIWYIPTIVLLPIIYFSAMGLMAIFGIQFPKISSPIIGIVIFFILFIIFAICEEVGWQGYAFGPLQERLGTMKAALILGVIGFIWHFPLFIFQNPPGGIIWVIGQGINLVLIRIMTVWIFTNTGKSIFAAVIFHAIYNLCTMVLPVYSTPLGPYTANVIILLTFLGINYFLPNQSVLFKTKGSIPTILDQKFSPNNINASNQ